MRDKGPGGGSSAAVSGKLISGRYRIFGEIGRGGMGAVYRARDESTGRILALKTLESVDPRVTRLFEREYHTLASLRHPRVIEVHDFGIDKRGQRFYTMELLAGDDLLELAPVPYVQACAHLHDVATCLALLHARRLLHRDISPGNVRIDAHGHAKLLDFGALGDFGMPREVVGTPGYMALENVRRLPLDQRSDLFSLGATLYFVLTGRAPFDVQRIEDIELAQRSPPLPPSALAHDVPRALDELVLSLLNVDPQRRPSSAAEVLDRLAAIAGLDAEPLTGIAESHLLSSALVGRDRELTQLNRSLRRALRGEGGVVIIEGAAGMGRTRLASELAIEARIAGLTSLRVDALAHPEPAGTVRALAQSVLESAPLEAAACFESHAGILAQAFEELRALVPDAVDDAPLPRDPAERKGLVQRTFSAWLLEIARARPLLLVLDDAHAADADSAGLLPLLAHAASRAPLLLVVTQERGALAPLPIQLLTRVAARITLHSLQREAIDGLVASVFGDVPHRTRLAQWLAAAGGGNPGHSLELLRQLVERGVIRYVGGAWGLPALLPEQELPRGADEALHARLRALGPEALRLARLFALQRGALPLQVCLRLAPEQNTVHTVSLLDRLVGSDILVRAADTYRFARDATRARVLVGVSPHELADLHGALAAALLEGRPELQTAVGALNMQDLGLLREAATHLERAGDARGRTLLREVAIELTMRGDGLSEAVSSLEAAVAVQRVQGRRAYELGPLLVPLSLAGTYCDFRLSYRYGMESLELLLDMSGLHWARRLRPWIGGRPALCLGLVAGFLRFRATGRNALARSFRDVLLGVMGIGTALLGTFSVLLDRAEAQRVAERLEILGFFPDGHAVRWVHTLQHALLDVTAGEIARACERALGTFDALRDLHGLREEARLQLQVGCLTPVSLAYALRVDGKVHEVFDALDRLRTSVSRQIAAGARAVYHGHRGERAKFIACHEEMDMLASQAGSTWREDVSTPRQLWSTYLLCEDVLGLKRAANDLDAFAELASIRKLRDVTRACYLCERGMPRQALAEYRALFETAIDDPGLQGARIAGAYARILRCAGEPERAREICTRALARLGPAEHVFKLVTFPLELELLLSSAALGELPRTAAQLAQLLEAQREHDNPLLHGLAHKACAVVALQARDLPSFTAHLSEMESWFRRTDNPALMAQCQRLLEQAQLAGLVASGRSSVSGTHLKTSEGGPVSAALRACRGPAEQLRVVIDLLLAETGGERGYLYLLEPAGLRFAAPRVGAEPPGSLRERMQVKLTELARDPTASLSGLVWGIPQHSDDLTPYTGLVLATARDRDVLVVGAVALVPGPQPLVAPRASFVESIARAIHAAEDVRSVYLEPGAGFVTVRAKRRSGRLERR